MKKIGLLLMGLLLTGGFAYAESQKHEDMPVIEGSAELQRMKSLTGRWEGSHKMGEELIPSTVIYETVSNGSAVLEKLFPGTPMEMISIYHDENDKLTMTHYCSLGNQPKMDLSESTADVITLDFSAENTLNPDIDQHMHSLTIRFNEDGSIVHNWHFFKEGKKEMSTVINLTKVN